MVFQNWEKLQFFLLDQVLKCLLFSIIETHY